MLQYLVDILDMNEVNDDTAHMLRDAHMVYKLILFLLSNREHKDSMILNCLIDELLGFVQVWLYKIEKKKLSRKLITN